MAGTFTHWMIAADALERAWNLSPRPSGLPGVLKHAAFVQMGAIGPDYPYLTEVLSGKLKLHSWADRMHFERTGEFVAHGVRRLATVPPADRDACLAFLLGFASHLVADAVIHPVVNATVGPVVFNDGPHRACEMTQDAWIYHAITGEEITNGAYVEQLQACSLSPGQPDRLRPALASYWRDVLRANHPGASAHFGDIDPDTWHANILERLGIATGPTPFFRHVGQLLGLDLFYRRSTDLPPADLERFVTAVTLPGGARADFRTAVFDRTVARVVDVWARLLADVAADNPDGCRAYLKNWNLDEGVDVDGAYFWAAA